MDNTHRDQTPGLDSSWRLEAWEKQLHVLPEWQPSAASANTFSFLLGDELPLVSRNLSNSTQLGLQLEFKRIEFQVFTSRFGRLYSSTVLFTLSWKSSSDRRCQNKATFPTKLLKLGWNSSRRCTPNSSCFQCERQLTTSQESEILPNEQRKGTNKANFCFLLIPSSIRRSAVIPYGHHNLIGKQILAFPVLTPPCVARL